MLAPAGRPAAHSYLGPPGCAGVPRDAAAYRENNPTNLSDGDNAGPRSRRRTLNATGWTTICSFFLYIQGFGKVWNYHCAVQS